jgi:serine phosphatase RsbU (regulator of sigma subunit)
MALKKSTKAWVINFAVSAVVACVIRATSKEMGCLGSLALANAIFSGLVLLAMGIARLFRLIVRRIALRLAFSYFLIGVVPIPLLAALLFAVSYVFASQLLGTRVRREADVVVEHAASAAGTPSFRVQDGKIESSDVDWLPPGTVVPWASRLDAPRPLLKAGAVWFAVPAFGSDPGRIKLVWFSDPSRRILQELADRTGYEVRQGFGRGRPGVEIDLEDVPDSKTKSRKREKNEWAAAARPKNRPTGGSGVEGEWLFGVYLEKPIAVVAGANPDRVVALLARTSPRILFDQIFAQGVPDVGRVFWGVVLGIGVALLLVYLVALGIAFYLVGTIARSVNRLTRTAQAIARGDFSVRVQSKARDQIGDLARSFDGMAESIERLLVQTAEKERLEGEIAIARTIQQKLLPPPEAEIKGLAILAHFQPVAEIGGDYYDYFSMPDGRIAVAVGDVSGHGLPTGLLVAMAKAALTTQIESGLSGSALFTRLNDLIHRSTDSRNYMTLSLLACDPATRRAELTNAGQLAPYRLSEGTMVSLSLPSFPLGTSPRSDFPTASYEVAAGDRLVFLTDGLVEAADPAGEPFGFERLEALLRAEASADAARLREAVLAAVSAHTHGAPPDDDRTLLIVTLKPVEDVAERT